MVKRVVVSRTTEAEVSSPLESHGGLEALAGGNKIEITVPPLRLKPLVHLSVNVESHGGLEALAGGNGTELKSQCPPPAEASTPPVG